MIQRKNKKIMKNSTFFRFFQIGKTFTLAGDLPSALQIYKEALE